MTKLVVLLFFRNMLDRYVNDEFKAADKDFSSGMTMVLLLLQLILMIQCGLCASAYVLCQCACVRACVRACVCVCVCVSVCARVLYTVHEICNTLIYYSHLSHTANRDLSSHVSVCP